MKKILVPIDFSENSKIALKTAIQLVNQLGGTVSVLHVFQSVTIPGSFETIDRVEKEEHEQKLLKLMSEMKPLLGDKTHLEGFVKKGPDVETICNTAEKLKVSMIVMGTTGADGMKKMFMGSTASNVILETSKPVLAIPKKFQNFQVSNITLALDNRKIKDVQVLQPVIDIITIFDSVLNLVTVIDEENPEFESGPTLQDQLKKIGIASSYHKVSSSDVSKGIQEFVAKENSDMLCLIHHSRGLFEEIFHSSVSEEIAFNSKVPLLVLID